MAFPTISKDYFLPVVIAVALHIGLLSWLALDFKQVDHKQFVSPKSIKASLVQMKQTAPKKSKPKIKKKPKPKAKPKKPKLKVKPKKKPKPKPKAKPSVKPKPKNNSAAKEKKRLADLAKAQQEQDRLKKVDKKRKEQAEQDAFDQDLLSELDAIEELEAAEQADEDEQVAMSYMTYIKQSIEQNWSRPPSARNGMQVSLRIELIPDGTVTNVNITTPSSSPAFDRSAIAAVKRAENFPELQELEPRVFEQFYRRFTLIFKPKDLRL